MNLLIEGWRPAEVARRLGVSDVSVLRWKRALASKGAEAWRRGRLGKPPKLKERHLLVLRNLLETSCTQHGYSDDRWTYRRLATVLRDLTGLSVHPDHLSRVIRGLNRGGWHPRVTIHGAGQVAMEAPAT
ncbi:MAG: helix-turn-helix domain-containing protein [Verrucomicrobiae bacterium]|nr:helix-turn-helix domain-containing protein [Verrucomicrobiae bacterium]